jgi:hypothetical protein
MLFPCKTMQINSSSFQSNINIKHMPKIYHLRDWKNKLFNTQFSNILVERQRIQEALSLMKLFFFNLFKACCFLFSKQSHIKCISLDNRKNTNKFQNVCLILYISWQIEMQMSIYIGNWRSTNILENCVLKSLFFQSRKWYIFGMC